MATLLHRLGKTAYRRWPIFIAGWIIAMLAVGGFAATMSKPMTDAFSIPGIPSERAADMQNELFPHAVDAFDRATVNVVVAAPEGHTLEEPAYANAVDDLVAELHALPQVPRDAPIADPVEAAGDVNTLLLDKTGTITLGNRQATEFVPLPGITAEQLADAAQLSSLADETPEGRSIVVLAKQEYGLRGREIHGLAANAEFVPFTAQTRMSGVDLDGREVRKGAVDAVENYLLEHEHYKPSAELRAIVETIAKAGGTPLVVADEFRPLGVIVYVPPRGPT